MTDQEIEQERQRIDPPLGPLYVDSKANERSKAIFLGLAKSGVFSPLTFEESERLINSYDYEGDGSIRAPFLTLDEARDVQKDGQDIIIAGYAVIGRSFAAVPQSIKERTE